MVSTHPPSASTNESGSTAHPIPKARLTAFSRFLSFRETFSRSSTPKNDFPPSSWELGGSKDNGAGASEWKYDSEKWEKDILELKDQVKQDIDKSREADQKQAAQPAPEPVTLAQRIKNMIDSLPLPTPSSSTTPVSSDKETQKDTPGVNRTPSGGIPSVPDTALRAWLYSESIMNGVATKGKESIFELLDKMSPSKKATTEKDEDKKTTSPSPTPSSDSEDTERDGIMMYAPLSPTPDSHPEIAESDIVDDGDQSPVLEYIDEHKSVVKTEDEKGKETAVKKRKEKAKTRREWYPSSSKLSIQTTWWGFRLYLPPPVLAVLSDAHLTAVQRGAMITAALKWMIDKLPVMMFPPQLRPAVVLLKRLSPFLGYVGAFVGWSWMHIKGYDQGNGVVLTSTWLVPIAMIPASWDFEVHGRPKDQEESTVQSEKKDKDVKETEGKDAKETEDKK